MTKIWYYIIKKFMGFLTSKEFFEAVVESVTIVSDEDLSGSEKKSLVVDEISELFRGETSTWVQSNLTVAINLGIELAVIFLKKD